MEMERRWTKRINRWVDLGVGVGGIIMLDKEERNGRQTTMAIGKSATGHQGNRNLATIAN
jgi:hypothetical protein